MRTAYKNSSNLYAILLVCLISLNVNGQNLKAHRWENRILIVKTSSTSSVQFQNQMKEFTEADEGLKERQLIIYEVEEDKYQYRNYKNGKTQMAWQISKDRFGGILSKNKNFEVILIGLDGGIKLRKEEVLTKKELFRIIDAMPMRVGEMRRRKN